MLQNIQLQESNSVSNDWTQRLFSQPKQLSEHIFQNIENISSRGAGLLMGCKRQDHHWSKRLFASAENGLKPYDKLVVSRDRKTLYEYEFRSSSSRVVIGNSGIADVVLEGPNVDQFHARVLCKNGQYNFEDLGSEKGSYLNGKKVSPNEIVELENGSSVRIMAFQIRFELRGVQSIATPILEALKIQYESRPQSAQIKSDQTSHISIASNLLDESQTIPQWRKGTTELIVTDIIEETDDVKTFRLTSILPLTFSYLPGQFVTLLLNIEGKEVQRSYSMSSSPSRPYTLDLTIKRVPGGLVSNWLCDHLNLGEKLKVKGPAGRFSCVVKPSEKLLFIGAGGGITPLMSMSRWLIDTASSVDTKVLFSFRNHEDVIFRKELEMMAESGRKLDIAITLTGEQYSGKSRNGFSGRIDKVMLESFVKDIHDRDVFLCGPEAFMNRVKGLLKTLSYPMQRLHCESFGSVQRYPEAALPSQICEVKTIETRKMIKQGALHTITFTKSNKIVQTDENTNLLQLAEGEGIEIDSSCKSGHCAECMIKCLAGRAEMDDNCDIDDQEREQGWVFSCCTFARSDLVINA